MTMIILAVLFSWIGFRILMWIRINAPGLDLLALLAYILMPAAVHYVCGDPQAERFWLGWFLTTMVLSAVELFGRYRRVKKWP